MTNEIIRRMEPLTKGITGGQKIREWHIRYLGKRKRAGSRTPPAR